MAKKAHLPLIAVAICVGILLVVYGLFAKWPGLSFSIPPAQLLSVMSPLLLAAAFIERAVEVVVSPWRDADAAVLQTAVDAAKAAIPPDAADIERKSEALTRYRGQTQQYAYTASILMGLGAAIVGIRALYPLLADQKFIGVPGEQKTAFFVVDVFLSAVLLAGGADGIHSIVTTFTGYFDATGEQMRKSAAS